MEHGRMEHGRMEHGRMEHGKMEHGRMEHGRMEQFKQAGKSHNIIMLYKILISTCPLTGNKIRVHV